MLNGTFLAATEYCDRGWSIIPLKNKHKPLVDWAEYQHRAADAAQVHRWWDRWPDAWIGLITGTVSGVVRIDVDGPVPEELLKSIPKTAEFSTPSGGRGYILKIPDGLMLNTDRRWTGEGKHEEFRIQCNGAYTVLPPSPGYCWVEQREIAELPRSIVDSMLAELAEAELKRLEASILPTTAQPNADVVADALAHLNEARADDRDSWIRVGMALHSGGASYLSLWIEFSRRSSKFREGECEALWSHFKSNGKLTTRSILHWAKEDGWRAPRLYEPLTDVGNGKTLARTIKDEFLYCDTWRKWLTWDGTRWAGGLANLYVVERAKKTVRDRYDRARNSLKKIKDISDEEEKKRKLSSISRVLKWCVVSEDAKHVHAAVDMAKSEAGIPVDASCFDKHPWLLNCPNGTLDLRRAKLEPHNPKQMLTALCPIEYYPDALCPRWEQFMVEVFDGDEELVLWMQKFLGYCLTGIIREHMLPVWHGSGRNGKSTLVKTVCSVLGPDYSTVTPSGFTSLSQNGQHPARMVLLHNKRFVADLETGDSMRLNEEMIKRTTGGDDIQARRMYENFWSFTPTHKLILATNYVPSIRGIDASVWARVKKVPFSVSFLGREDFTLSEKLQVEAPGILRWMVDGCMMWQEHGLGEPKAVTSATETYRQEENSMVQFFADTYQRKEGSKVLKLEVTGAYRRWCYAHNAEAISDRAFGLEIKKLGVEKDGRWYIGIAEV